MKLYRIGELAKMMCVSLDFIRFYEEKGLIRSTIDRNNHYHYYDISQSEIIYKILQYRKLGYNVNETVELLKNADKEEMLQMYESQIAFHKNSLNMSAYAIRYLDFLKTTLTTKSGTWYITREPAIWFLPHTRDDDYLADPAILSAYRAWNEKIPIVFGMDRWIISPEGILKEINHGRAIECSVAEEFGLHPGEPALLYPEKRCIEYYLDNENPAGFNWAPSIGLSYIHAAIDVVKEKQFVVDGDVFVRHILFYGDSERRHDLFVVYIPIQD